MWKPDVHIFNSLVPCPLISSCLISSLALLITLGYRASGKDDVYVISWRVPIRIFANGQVILWTPVIFDVTCLFDFTDFPYDRQSCSVSFGSIVYPTNKVDYKWAKKSPVTLRLAYQSDKRHLSGWEIQSATASKMYLNEGGRVNQSSNSTTEWAELLFRIDMQRHSPYFNLLFVSPALVAALLTLFSMFLRNAEVAATVLLRNLVIQALFLRGLITILPLSIGNSPKIGSIATVLMFFSLRLLTSFFGVSFQ